LRRIEAAREVAVSVAQSSNKVYLNADNLLLNHLGEAQAISLPKKLAPAAVAPAPATAAPTGKLW
jgi:hypothetical protein